MRQQRAVLALVLVAGLIGGVAAPVALAGLSSPACAFADSETATECVISSNWTIGAGGVLSNNFPAPGLPGPYAFHKDLHITNTGDIQAIGTLGITLNIDGAQGGTGALIMDAAASVINTSEDGDPPNSGAGPVVITATGGASLAVGSTIKAENTTQGGGGGDISLSFGASSSFAGLISSQAKTGTTSNSGGDITITVTGDLVVSASAEINSEKNADSGKSGDIVITVSGDMTMQGGGSDGATITANHPNATNGLPGGNIRIDVGSGNDGVFTMQSGTLIDSGGGGRAGNIWINAGESIDIAQGARVLAGQRSEQSTRGHGGRIWVEAGCEVNIDGTLSSQGQDPGADLVHVSGCQVNIGATGVVESTGNAHEPGAPASCDNVDDDNASVGGAPASVSNQPGEVLRDHPATSSTCVEIWGRHIVIDSGAQVSADFALGAGTQGHGWIDIFAEQDVTIHGPASGNYTVHVNSLDGNDVAGDLTVKAKKGFVWLDGLSLQANATSNGSSGGHVIVQAKGNVTFDGTSVEALGSQGTNAGHVEDGGTIEGRSFAGTLTGGPAGKLDTAAFDNNGAVILQSCLGTTYTGYTAPGALSILANDCSVTEPSFPAYVNFNPNGAWDECGTLRLSGLKFNDLDNNNANNGEPGLSGWTIHVTGPNSFDTTAVTGVGGAWSLVLPGPGTYTVCEVLQPNWTQTYPLAGPGTTGCAPGEGPIGYLVNTADFVGGCCNGADITGLDFGNFLVQRLITCKEDPNRAPLLTRTVNLNMPLGGGGVAGDPQNYGTLQAAYDAAKVSLQTEVIGMYSKTTENVVLNGSKSLTITQCESAQITAANSALPVWKITSTGKLLIIGPDSVGGTVGWELVTGGHTLKSIRSNGASVAGVRVSSNSNDVSFNNISSSGIGLDILGSSNKFKSGTIGPNTGGGVHIGAGKTGNSVSGATIQDNAGYGVWVEGNSNTISSNKLYRNALGIKITGASNQIKSNQVETSTGDGIYVAGNSNVIQDNKVSKNGGNGITVAAGTGNNLKSNSSNNSGENAGFEFARSVAIVNGGSNKADGKSIPSSAKCSAFFAGATASCE